MGSWRLHNKHSDFCWIVYGPKWKGWFYWAGSNGGFQAYGRRPMSHAAPGTSPSNLQELARCQAKPSGKRINCLGSHLHSVESASLLFHLESKNPFGIHGYFSSRNAIQRDSATNNFFLGQLRCFSDQNVPEWEDCDFLSETNELLHTYKAVRPVHPEFDDHLYTGERKRFFSDGEIISRISSILKMHAWGPETRHGLDSLNCSPKPYHVAEVLKLIRELNVVKGFFSWFRQQKSYMPNAHVFTILIGRLGNAGDIEGLRWLLATMHQERCDPTSKTYDALIKFYVRSSKLDEALGLLIEMQKARLQPELSTFKTLIGSFLKSGLHEEVLKIFEQMEMVGCIPDQQLYELFIPILLQTDKLDKACQLFDQMKAKGYTPQLAMYASLIERLGRAGRLDNAMKLFEEIQEAGMSLSAGMFTSVIEAFGRAGKLEMAMGIFKDMTDIGMKPDASLFTFLIEAHLKAWKLDTVQHLLKSMLDFGQSPSISLYSNIIDSHLKAMEIHTAKHLFDTMQKTEALPAPRICFSLVEAVAQSGDLESALNIFRRMQYLGLQRSEGPYAVLLLLLMKNNKSDDAMQIAKEMRENQYSVNGIVSNFLMSLLLGNQPQAAGKWYTVMIQVGVQPNTQVCHHLLEACLKNGIYDPVKHAFDQFMKSGSLPDLQLYTLILSSFSRCVVEKQERVLMSMMHSTRHEAHKFICGLFSGPQQMKESPLDYVRSFYQKLENDDVKLARWFTCVLLNYLVLLGQIKRARCIWKVAYEKKIFPGRILFDQDIAWSLDVRTLSIGTALTAVVHTLHRFRKRMLYYDTIPRRIKIVTGFSLKDPVEDMLKPLGSPFENSGGCFRCRGQFVAEWFKQPFVEKFLENEIPSRDEIRLQKLKLLFPKPAQEPYMLIMNSGMLN
eukprot:c25419_g1_i2 orf=379-3072(+)